MHLSHPELYILVISFTDIIGSKSWFWITRAKNITSSYDAHAVSYRAPTSLYNSMSVFTTLFICHFMAGPIELPWNSQFIHMTPTLHASCVARTIAGTISQVLTLINSIKGHVMQACMWLNGCLNCRLSRHLKPHCGPLLYCDIKLEFFLTFNGLTKQQEVLNNNRKHICHIYEF